MKNFVMTNTMTQFAKAIVVENEVWDLIIERKIETPKTTGNDGYKPWTWFAIIAIYNQEHMDDSDWAFCGHGDTLAEAIYNLKNKTKVMKDGIEIPAYQEYPWFNYKNNEEWDWRNA